MLGAHIVEVRTRMRKLAAKTNQMLIHFSFFYCTASHIDGLHRQLPCVINRRLRFEAIHAIEFP
jgi:hypothetical protein